MSVYIAVAECENVDGFFQKGQKKLNLSGWYKMISASRWQRELADGVNDQQAERLRLNTHTGRPLGSDSFLSKCEKLIGRRVRPLPIGRPKKRKR